jgi:hypothetical protein
VFVTVKITNQINMKTKIQTLELGRRIDSESVHFSAMVGSELETSYPVDGTLNLKTNTAHLNTSSQTLQDDQFEDFDICAAIESR